MTIRWYGITLTPADIATVQTARSAGVLDPFTADHGSGGDVLQLGEAWQPLHHLLTAAGRQHIADALLPGQSPDNGDEGVRLLDEHQVHALAAELMTLHPDQLWAGYDATRFNALDIPPGPWTVASVKDYLQPSFTSLVAFFGLAAASGEGIMITVT